MAHSTVCFCQFRSVNHSLFDTSALIRSRLRRRQHKEARTSLKFTTVLPFDPNFNMKSIKNNFHALR